MRSSSIIACCTVLLSAATATASAQSLGDVSPQGAEFGPMLPSIGEFRADYSSDRRKAAFDRPMPEISLETPDDAEPTWFDPTIVIAGARVSPDVRHKGLKVRIPMELLQSDSAAASDQGSDLN
jgi:hypothetical protein